MNRIELVRQSVENHLGDIRALLAMRLCFPPDNVVVTIEKELQDLYTYPERLETSHRDEWTSIAVKAVYRNGFSNPDLTDQINIDIYIAVLIEEVIPRCKHEHPLHFRRLDEILAIGRADNTITFPGPGRRNLIRLIWPDYK